jgi:hypothetical protein
MALAYTPPGVSIEELTSPNVSPLLAVPALIGLIGPAQNYIERTDLVSLQATIAVALPNLPAGAVVKSVVSVRDAVNPGAHPVVSGVTQSAYRVTSDYTVNLSAGTVTSVTYNSGTGVGLIDKAAGTSDIRSCYVTYRYLPAEYFQPIRLDSLAQISRIYGPAYKDGEVFSPLTLAASIAFENGARSIVCQALYQYDRTDPSLVPLPRIAPVTGTTSTVGAISNPATWEDTFNGLRDIEDINVFVPIIGQNPTENINDAAWLAIVQKSQDHLSWLKSQYQYGVTILGEDSVESTSSAVLASKTTIQTHAGTLRDRLGGTVAEQTVLINTAKFPRSNPDQPGLIDFVGAQYMAAALAGMLATRQVSSPITRRQVSGFSGVSEYRSLQDKNDDASLGLLVIEQKGQAVIVRHAITLDNDNQTGRELSVVRAKHYVVESIRQTIDSNVIGVMIADEDALTNIETLVIGVLDELRENDDIVTFANVQVRQSQVEPTVFEVRFSYLPAFPINYVHIAFSIDLTLGGVTTTNLDGTVE